VFYKEEDGKVPVLDWLDNLPTKLRYKFIKRIDRLKVMGHELRRPIADFLRDGIYELRVRHGRVNYRLLYFFHGNVAAVLSHGLTKEKRVPPREIEKAIERKRKFEQNPQQHTQEEI